MNYVIDINVCYSIVFESLAVRRGIQAMAETLFVYTRMPIHVVDISFKVLAAAYGETTGSKHIDRNLKAGFVSTDVVVEEYYRQGYIDIPSRSEKSVIVDWGVVEKAQATGAIRVKGNTEGFCATTYGDPALASVALQINDILCKAIAIEMEREQQVEGGVTDPMHQSIARELFGDLLPDGGAAPDNGFVDRGRLRPGYMITVIAPGMRNNARIQHIRNAVLVVLPDAFYVIRGGYLYVFFAGLLEADAEVRMAQEMGRIMAKYQAYCGMSDVFTDLGRRSQFRLGAQKALEVGCALHPDRHVFPFSEYYLEIVASYAVNALGEFSYRLPELERIRAVDKEKGTDYYHTLKTHFVMGNNINLTAGKLHIHRNTLIYRISKIEEITGLNINDHAVIRRLLTGMTMRYVDQALRNQTGTSPGQTADFWAND